MKPQQCESLLQWEAAIRRWKLNSGNPMPELSEQATKELQARLTRNNGEVWVLNAPVPEPRP